MQQMFGERSNRQLSLNIRLLVDGSGDGSGLNSRKHFTKQVGGNHPHPAYPIFLRKCPAHGQAIDGVHINSGEIRYSLEQSPRFAKAFAWMLVSFDDVDYCPAHRELAKAGAESFCLLTVIDRLQHAGDDRDFTAMGHEVGHEFAGDQSVEPWLYTYNRGTPAHGSVGGDTDDARAFFFGGIDQRRHRFGIARRKKDAIDL